MLSLPVELVVEILRWATYEPIAADIGYIPLVLSSNPDNGVFLGPKPDSMAAKRAFVLVSRVWRTLALPFLYETLYIDDEEFARKLCILLTRPNGSWVTGPGTRERGSFVRKVYINSRCELFPFATWEHRQVAHGKILARIIQLCPSLVILSHRGLSIPPLIRPAVSVLFSAIRFLELASNVRKLDLGCSRWCTTRDIWELITHYIEYFPALESLVIPSDVNVESFPTFGTEDSSSMRAEKLRTIVLPVQCYVLMRTHPTRWHLPALADIHLTCFSLSFGHIYNLPATLHDTPRDDPLNLLVHSLCFDATSRLMYAQDVDRNPCFHYLHHFPNLVYLVLPVLETNDWDTLAALRHTSLEHIGLSLLLASEERRNLDGTLYDRQTDRLINQRMTQLDTAFSSILSADLPSLQTVRIVDHAFETHVRRFRPRWGDTWIRHFSERDITLEWSSDFIPVDWS